MKKHLRFTNNKTAVAALISFSLTIALAGISFVPRTANGAFDFDALSRQVEQNTQDISNHEARITNTEKDVSKLQSDTGTAPASGKVAVPAGSGGSTTAAPVTTTQPAAAPAPAPPAPAPQPAPKTLVSTSHYVCQGSPNYNMYSAHYSDGSMANFHQDGTPEAPGTACGVVDGATW